MHTTPQNALASPLSPLRLGRWLPAMLVAFALAALHTPAPLAADEYYTGEHVYNSRPNPTKDRPFGHIGPTGIEAFIYPGVKVAVEDVAEGSPAEGKFEKGDVIVGVNGTVLKGLNPFVALGQAITAAEAGDGKLVFDVRRGEKDLKTTVTIPVLGAYSDTWPVGCPKTDKIIEQAAAYYRQQILDSEANQGGIPRALMCLFLLSTGDDDHLPVVKQYFQPFIDNAKGIGEHTWNNGYNGIACAEYYLRTGDKDVLPVLQAFVDDAERRQKFDAGWPHWGDGINPRYVAGGLMNAASVQVLTTMLLAKECGVDVDDRTLNNSLKFFYRFVGHGTVPYGDHRGEGGLGSNGKDGMLAAAMQVASGATGDTEIYESARDYLSMSMITSYPSLATGHGDNGRGDGIWRGLSASLLKDKQPAEYRAMLDRLTWWYDLSRFHNGAVGMATVRGFNDSGSGAAVAMTYTAPRRHLRIGGAPRSEHAVDFELPADLWGRPADRVFHGIENLPGFDEYGEEVQPHRLLRMVGNAYKQIDPEQSGVTRPQLMQAIHHRRYMFRSQAAKTLRQAGEFSIIENLLRHPDPRVRRAGLDGITDWRYWFAMGKQPLQAQQYTPGMIDLITSMISDPDEALYVIEGALYAMHHMPADAIAEHRDAVTAWTDHDDWWLREASFMALQGLEKDPERYRQVLPTLIGMMIDEYHTMPRQRMVSALSRAVRDHGPDSAIGKTIVAGFKRATGESEIKPGLRTREGSYNVIQSVKQAIRFDPANAAVAARMLRDRFDKLDTGRLLEIIDRAGEGRSGFYPILAELKGAQKTVLADLLHNQYLPELTQRLKAESGTNLALIDTVLALKELKQDVTGWQVLGSPEPGQRVWQYTTVDPASEDETQPRRERKRFRQITLPEGLSGWHQPAFEPEGWNTGHAPIGVGVLERGGKKFENRSQWGDGEFLLARTTFEIDSLDYDLYRLSILNNQGFHIYLNGKKISTYIWWNDKPRYWKRNLSQQHVKLLKKGTNTLAVYANVEYPSAMKPHRWDRERLGQIDCWIESLRQSDLY